MRSSTEHRRAPLAAVVALAGALCGAASAHAGPFVAAQQLGGSVRPTFQQELAVGPGGGAAVAFGAATRAGSPGGVYDSDERVYVAVHDQGTLATSQASGGFGAPLAVSPAGYPVAAVRLGIDAAGATTAVYWLGNPSDAHFEHGAVYARHRPANGTWSPAQRLASQVLPYQAQYTAPELVVAPDGRATVLTEAGLFTRGPGATSFTALPGTADVRHVAMNDAGHIAATTLGPANPETGRALLSVKVRPAGGIFGAATLLGPLQAGEPVAADRSSIAITNSGNVVVGWEPGPTAANRSGPFALNVSVRTTGSTVASGTWSTTQLVDATRGVLPGASFGVSVRAESSTKAAVSWSQDGTGPWFFRERRQQLLPSDLASVVVPSTVQAVSAGARGRSLAAAGDPALSSDGVRIQVRPAWGEAFARPQTILAAPEGESYIAPRVGLDDQGNGWVSWIRLAPGPNGAPGSAAVGVTGYDPVPPVFNAVSVSAATAGAPVAFSAAATDRMSAPALTWDFGDGTAAAAGASVSHTYALPGTYTAKVVARDAAGNSASYLKTVVVN